MSRSASTDQAAQLLSCDTLVAFPDSGRAIFGKNSDRGTFEAQLLESVAGAFHPAGSQVRCQYLTIPQAPRTLAVLGSRPWWLWGFEQGVNEAGVAIGNEALYTRDEVAETGLLGMDLVRLGLERGSTAREALATIIELLERYGQGGKAVYLPSFTAYYQNSFIIADAREAYVLETSRRHWVYKRVVVGTAIANLLTIEDDWDEASEGIEAYAHRQGWWWGPPGQKLNFREAFEDASIRVRAQDRYEASCRFLARPELASVRGMMRHLRDHFEGGTIHVPETTDRSWPRSICCHPGRFASATAASMVVELSADQRLPIAWCSMATPCTSAFLPVPVGSALPPALTVGGASNDDYSLWWAMRRLADAADADPAALTPLIQKVLVPWEQQLFIATEADPKRTARDLGSRVETLRGHADRLMQLVPAAEPEMGLVPLTTASLDSPAHRWN
jgi:dipeptidase